MRGTFVPLDLKSLHRVRDGRVADTQAADSSHDHKPRPSLHFLAGEKNDMYIVDSFGSRSEIYGAKVR